MIYRLSIVFFYSYSLSLVIPSLLLTIKFFKDVIELKKIIFDCDNTMGLERRDVDDGLTLMYLLGREDVELVGVTTTYGNSNINDVYENTQRMFSELHLDSVPLLRGAPSKHIRQSEASHFLLQKARQFPGEITLLATGSLSNLLGAYELDSDFFSYLKQVVLMGGITEPLLLNGIQMDELNFSCDPEATHRVFSKAKNLTVISAQLCLQALFGSEEYDRLMKSPDVPSYIYIREKTLPWFEYIGPKFNTPGFYNWDIVAGVFITNPELFDLNVVDVYSSVEDLKRGFIKTSPLNSNVVASINLPTTILDKATFTDTIFASWKSVSL